MFANRTIAWFGNYIAGKQELIKQFFKNSIQKVGESKEFVLVRNTTDIKYTLLTNGKKQFILPNSICYLNKHDLGYEFKVINAIIGTNKVLTIDVKSL